VVSHGTSVTIIVFVAIIAAVAFAAAVPSVVAVIDASLSRRLSPARSEPSLLGRPI
jgi:hypothetical protein